MAITKKLKFRENEIVLDGATGYMGIISDYLGQGLYVLSQVRAPFIDLRGNSIGMMDINLDKCRIVSPLPGINDREILNRYIQISRYLIKANENQVREYNRLIEIPEDNQEYYLYDGFQNLYLLMPGGMFVNYRGGISPLSYNLEAHFTTYWSVSGNIFTREIRSVNKEVLKAPGGTRFNLGRLIRREEIDYLFDWEREYAPFVIEGRIL